MMKIDFAKKTIQFWPGEYQGQIQISLSSLSFTTLQGSSNFNSLPREWRVDENIMPQANLHSLSSLFTSETFQERLETKYDPNLKHQSHVGLTKNKKLEV